MSILQLSIYSQNLMLNTNVNVILPLPNVSNMESNDTVRLPKNGEAYQVLWLLHPGSGAYDEYLRFTRIEEWAHQRQVAVIMPDVANSYYCNIPHGAKYYDYYTQELPEIMRAIFPISDKKADNFIGGVSMGGFGAFAAALRNPDNYQAAFAISGGLDFKEGTFGSTLTEYHRNTNLTLFGEDGRYYDSHAHDLPTIAKDLVQSQQEHPLFLASNGTEDMVTKDCCFPTIEKIRNHGVKVEYTEKPGTHSWDFWNPELLEMLNALPLKRTFV